ncbi:cell division protein ZipA [Motilimonas cestriensis]|uniref:Cell division protein ZipA n=1 Tax=Motilimonas cestriensis TaxID=2742685 RepID=A0ABS8W4F6_9GAMM|nr:cell division protein ZipA [Motilimonas cestriensis]MCE2593398.1 cell division protein ZipA [Motilimonas cestriensis]
MQDFRLVLIIVGAIAIAALLIHGLWSNHKNKPKSLKDKPVRKVEPKEASAETEFDSDGIGEVRVVSSSFGSSTEQQDDYLNHTKKANPDLSDDLYPSFSAVEPEQPGNITPVMDPVTNVSEPIAPQPAVETEPNPAPSASQQDVLQQSVPEADEVEYVTRAPAFREPYFDEHGQKHYHEAKPVQVKVKPVARPVAPEPLAEPVVAAKVETTIEQEGSEAPAPQETAEKPAKAASAYDGPQDVFVLNVMSQEGSLFAGAELLPILLNLGFKFGEMDIFHRHLSPTGNGPVLFSMANMVKPGTFDVDHMEQFETHGLSLFMALPCAGDASNNFQLMLHASEMLASELNGLLLDGTRQPLTRQKVNEYKQRITDFERQALVD